MFSGPLRATCLTSALLILSFDSFGSNAGKLQPTPEDSDHTFFRRHKVKFQPGKQAAVGYVFFIDMYKYLK